MAFPKTETWVVWVNGALLLVLAHGAARLTWEALPTPAFDAPVAGAMDSNDLPALKDRTGLADVARLHLFGEAPKEQPKPVETPQVEAPETRLNLTLRGVLATGGENAAAIIADGGGLEANYRVGDRTPGGAVLSDVQADRVILERNGRFETLKLVRDEPLGAAADEPTGTAGNSEVAQKLGAYRDKILNDPRQLWSLAQVQPVTDNGRLKGYRINPRRERRLFYETGLRPGDVVTEVNGITLDNPATLGRVISQLSRASTLNLTVERAGRRQQIAVPLGN